MRLGQREPLTSGQPPPTTSSRPPSRPPSRPRRASPENARELQDAGYGPGPFWGWRAGEGQGQSERCFPKLEHAQIPEREDLVEKMKEKMLKRGKRNS